MLRNILIYSIYIYIYIQNSFGATGSFIPEVLRMCWELVAPDVFPNIRQVKYF